MGWHRGLPIIFWGWHWPPWPPLWNHVCIQGLNFGTLKLKLKLKKTFGWQAVQLCLTKSLKTWVLLLCWVSSVGYTGLLLRRLVQVLIFPYFFTQTPLYLLHVLFQQTFKWSCKQHSAIILLWEIGLTYLDFSPVLRLICAFVPTDIIYFLLLDLCMCTNYRKW